MPERIFVAHSRTDRAAVEGLVGAMRALGYTVALDDLLPGGREWWSTVVNRIARCEVFVYAVSGSSLDSEACKAEHRYAADLGMPALPVVVGEGVADALVSPELARLQRVDYRGASKQAMAEMYRSIESLGTAELRPAEPPAVPTGFELDLAGAVRGDYIEPAAQQQIVAQLESLVAAGVAPAELGDVVSKLRTRKDLTVRADEQLAALSAGAEKAEGPSTSLTSDPVDDRAPAPRQGANRIFISYSRSDAERVGSLAADLRHAGFDVWLDRELPGGTEWWNEILLRIRETDAFVVAASAASRSSRACAAELEYAQAVRKPILHVAIDPVTGASEGVDVDRTYLDASARDLAGVISALRDAHAPELPVPLPHPPPVPASYLFDTRVEIHTQRVLKPSEQIALIEQLGHHLDGDISPHDILRLSTELRSRDDLTVEAARALDVVQGKAGAAVDRSRELGLQEEPSAAPPDAQPSDEPIRTEDRTAHQDSNAAVDPGPPESVPADRASPAKAGRRRGRRAVAVAGILAVAIAGGGVVRSLLQDGGDSSDVRDDRNRLTSVAPQATTAPVATAPGTSPPDVVIEAETGFEGIVGTMSFNWAVNGATHEATLAADGPSGHAHVGFYDAQGVYWEILQDVALQEHPGGWAYVGSDPRFADGTPAVFYAPDVFFLEQSGSLWYVAAVCDTANLCAPVQ